jgi:acyl-CoA synthetase (AMP-forming)/AMP-acid ligase II
MSASELVMIRGCDWPSWPCAYWSDSLTMCVNVRTGGQIVNDEGAVCPNDGKTSGHLMVRGPAIAGAYFKGERRILDHQGFFDTGDVSTLSSEGVMSITDRDKDVIKSGGEWISSIEIENEAVGHPEVKTAAFVCVCVCVCVCVKERETHPFVECVRDVRSAVPTSRLRGW